VTGRAFGRRLGLVALAGLAWRVGYIVAVKGSGTDTCGRELCGDALWYSSQGRRLALGHLFTLPGGGPTAEHPPLASLAVAPASMVIDGSFVQRLAMALVGVAVIVVIGLLARRLAGDRAGLLAAGIAALYPNLWMNDVVVMAEAVTALVVALFLLAVYRYRDDPRPAGAAMLGALVGLAALARSEQALLGLLVVAPVVLAVGDQAWAARLGRLALAGAVALATVAPWIGYNLARFEEPTTLSTNDGLTLLGANCDQVYRGPATGFWSLECGLAVSTEGDPSQVSARQRDAAFDYIGSHKRDLPRVMLVRVGRVWSLYAPDQMAWLNQGEGRERWASWAGFWSFLALAPAAVAGAVVLRRRGVAIWPLAATAVLVTVTAALFYGIVRFRVPAEVATVVLAAVALDAGWRRLADRHRSPTPAPAPS
jgi:4-amino-4-deoxy-L-arabinose transferase-like glycosyltransferase